MTTPTSLFIVIVVHNRLLISLSECRIYASVNRVSIDSDNGLSSIRRQAIIWTNAVFFNRNHRDTSEILIKIQNFSFTKMRLEMSSVKWPPFCSGRDELKGHTSKKYWHTPPTFKVTLHTNSHRILVGVFCCTQQLQPMTGCILNREIDLVLSNRHLK